MSLSNPAPAASVATLATTPAPATAVTVAPAIPFRRDSGPASSALGGGAVGVLVISLVAIVAVLVVRKRLGLGQLRTGTPGMLKVLETQRLGPRALLSVVEFSGAHYLIAQGENGISCVASKPIESMP